MSLAPRRDVTSIRGRGCNQLRLAEVVFGFEVLDLGLVGSVDDADRDREDSVALLMLVGLQEEKDVHQPSPG